MQQPHNCLGQKDDFSDHGEALDKLFQITRDNNLHTGFVKIQYQKSKKNFFGDTYTNKGHQPTNDEIKAILDMKQPTNVKEL